MEGWRPSTLVRVGNRLLAEPTGVLIELRHSSSTLLTGLARRTALARGLNDTTTLHTLSNGQKNIPP